ncbi:MAG: universal stress protein [Planctomycetia bacterium]
MPVVDHGFKSILVAIDFSAFSDAALSQAIWLARQCGARLVLAHAIEDLRRAAHVTSSEARRDILSGEGDLFQKEIRSMSDQKLRDQIASIKSSELKISSETLLGEAFVEVIHAVQQEGHDLVMTGTRGFSGWKQFFVGSTARKLIRKCPSAVWIVKAEHAQAPKVILAPSDFSDVSRQAVLKGLWLAERSGAEFHLLHVIDSGDVRDDLLDRMPQGRLGRDEINQKATERLEAFIASSVPASVNVTSHLTWGYPWQEIGRIASKHNVDLISMGTVGRSGVKGVLLGNTAERVLDTCDCSILTVKPDDYVSPISQATWQLHP